MSKHLRPKLLTLSLIVILLSIGVLSQAQNTKKCNSIAFDPQIKVSATCPNSCQICSNSTSLCLNCKPGFYLAAEQCFPCVINCKNCSNIYTCDNCQTGYVYAKELGACVLLQCTKPHCISCSAAKNYSVCDQCADGYMLSSSICVTCIDGCSKCSNNICQQCKPGYYRLGLSCFPCISNCVTCKDNSSCGGCMNEYAYNSEQRNCYFSQGSSSSKSKLLAILISIAAFVLLVIIIISVCLWRKRKSSSSTQVVEADLLASINRLEVQELQQCGNQQVREWMKQQCHICLHLGCDARTTCKHYFHLQCLLAWKALKQSCPTCSSPNVGIRSICKKCNNRVLGLPKDLNKISQQVTCLECSNKTAPSL